MHWFVENEDMRYAELRPCWLLSRLSLYWMYHALNPVRVFFSLAFYVYFYLLTYYLVRPTLLPTLLIVKQAIAFFIVRRRSKILHSCQSYPDIYTITRTFLVMSTHSKLKEITLTSTSIPTI